MKRTASVILALGSVLLLPAAAPAQCAMCRSVLQSPEGLQMIAALRSGVLVLLAAPFAVFGAVAFLACRTQRRRDRERWSRGAAA